MSAARNDRRRARYAQDPGPILRANRQWMRDNPQVYEAKKARTRGENAWSVKNPCARLYRRMAWSAKKRGYDFSITEEEVFRLLQPMVCAVTGLPLTWDDDGHNAWRPSPDRIDNSLGYIPGNVRIVCWIYNRTRGVYSDEVVLLMARAIVQQSK